MKINPTLGPSAYSGLGQPQPRKTSQPSFDEALQEATSNTSNTQKSSQTQNVDLTNVTPNQMHGVAKQLFNDGKINERQYSMLSLGEVRVKVGSNGQGQSLTPEEQSVFDNTPIDYLKWVNDRIDYIRSTGGTGDPKSGYSDWTKIAAVLQSNQSGASRIA